MNKKILTIGSIISTIILVLVTFTSVVGFQAVESSGVRGSPLFSVRMNRTIQKDSNELTCDYIGKGSAMAVFPTRNNKISMIREVIERLLTMDDDEFNRFIHIVFNSMEQKNNLRDVDMKKAITAFYQVRDNPELLKKYGVHGQNNFTFQVAICTIDGGWRPGCYIWAFIGVVWYWVLTIYSKIFNFISNLFSCWYPSVDCC